MISEWCNATHARLIHSARRGIPANKHMQEGIHAWQCSCMQVRDAIYVPVSSLNAHRNRSPETSHKQVQKERVFICQSVC